MRDQQPVDDRARDVLAAGHQHLERGDPPEVERRLTDERMTGMDDHRHPLEIELLEGEPDHLVGVGQAPDHDIELAALQSLQEDAIGAGDQMHGRIPTVGREGADRLGHETHGHGRQGADLDVAVALQLALGHAVDRLLQRDHPGGGVVLEGLAQRREHQALGSAGEQADVQQLLELAQGLGHRRLRHRELIGRAPDMAEPRHLHEALQVADLHARIDHAPPFARWRNYRTVIARRQVLISAGGADRPD